MIASGTEAGTGETEGLDPKGESAVPNGETPNPGSTPETGLVEALERALRIRIWNECKERGMRDADAYKRINAEVAGIKTASLSNVLPDEV